MAPCPASCRASASPATVASLQDVGDWDKPSQGALEHDRISDGRRRANAGRAVQPCHRMRGLALCHRTDADRSCDDSAPLPEGIEAQTRRVLDNLKLVLAGIGSALDRVVF